ncbi:hypothetical protein M885DRAFT_517795 [Pelagophyceae sp. CCMP2097]|nr:hypothetical protein M885DRAFT_517795 [Pelagophyceae sp. CCMP2097]
MSQPVASLFPAKRLGPALAPRRASSLRAVSDQSRSPPVQARPPLTQGGRPLVQGGRPPSQGVRPPSSHGAEASSSRRQHGAAEPAAPRQRGAADAAPPRQRRGVTTAPAPTPPAAHAPADGARRGQVVFRWSGDELPQCIPQFDHDRAAPPSGRAPVSLSQSQDVGRTLAPGWPDAAERPPSRAGSDSPAALRLQRRPYTTAGAYAPADWTTRDALREPRSQGLDEPRRAVAERPGRRQSVDALREPRSQGLDEPRCAVAERPGRRQSVDAPRRAAPPRPRTGRSTSYTRQTAREAAYDAPYEAPYEAGFVVMSTLPPLVA